MRINVSTSGLPLTATLLDHIERRLHFGPVRSSRIRKVVVRLGEIDLARRGADKFCRMEVYLEEAAPVLIEDTGPDLYTVINRVADRARRKVRSCVQRQAAVRLTTLGRSAPPAIFALGKI